VLVRVESVVVLVREAWLVAMLVKEKASDDEMFSVEEIASAGAPIKEVGPTENGL